ncbi:MAG: hypothetical protein NVSMB62_24260 [Acidobacteriaceae bacterium]
MLPFSMRPKHTWIRRKRQSFCRSLVTNEFPAAWHSRLIKAHAVRTTVGLFLGAIGCDRLIEETFHGTREDFIDRVNGTLAKTILRIQGRERAAAASVELASSQTDQSGSYPSRVVTEIDVDETSTTLEKAAV